MFQYFQKSTITCRMWLEFGEKQEIIPVGSILPTRLLYVLQWPATSRQHWGASSSEQVWIGLWFWPPDVTAVDGLKWTSLKRILVLATRYHQCGWGWDQGHPCWKEWVGCRGESLYSEVQCIMVNDYMGPPLDRQTDTYNWKHYLSATSLAGGNKWLTFVNQTMVRLILFHES